MKDIPMFTTEYGIASLILKEIPYMQTAYVRVQSTDNLAGLLRECIDFCRACGAEKIYATGHEDLSSYPLHAEILRMQSQKDNLGQTDAALFPVTEETLPQWLKINRQKMARVPNCSYMTDRDAKEMLQRGDGYFIHRKGTLLGIGMATGEEIFALASCEKGAGGDIVRALASLPGGDTVNLTVARENGKALELYKRLGFVVAEAISHWYQIF